MKVKWWDWNDQGQEVLFTGTVLEEFVDPDEKYKRSSYSVRTEEGRVHTPHTDECVEIEP